MALHTKPRGTEVSVPIIDDQDYKLVADLREFKPRQWQLTIKQWTPESGWSQQHLFMQPEQLVRFKELFES
jgi:hypothetical protein